MVRLCLVLLVLLIPTAALPAGHGDARVSTAIDAGIAAALTEAKVAPAGPADDTSFVRRVHLDLLGRVPTAEEARAFLADRSPDRHAELIDALLDHEEMPAYWSLVLHAWLNGRSPDPGFGYPEFRAYLEKSLAQNKHWDVLARELLVPGDVTQAASFFLASRLMGSKEDRVDAMTVAVASTFFGVRLECARCHDHPYVEGWKQAHYYGLGAFLHRTEQASRNGKPAVTEKGSGELTYQDRQRMTHTARLMFLDGRILDEPKAGTRRLALADYALNAQNPYFKKAIVNRVWKQLLGVGLVEPVDQIHSANNPSHPKIFDLLADDLAANGFDLKRLLAVILHTEAYRRSSAWQGQERPRDNLYAARVLRPLAPEQLALSVLTATRYADVLARTRRGAKEVRSEIDKEVRSFVRIYDSDADAFAATTQQALFLTYNKSTQKYLAPAADNLTARLVKAPDAAEVGRIAFLHVLSREPTKDEAAAVEAYLKTPGVPRAQLCREIAWALLTGAEFRFSP